jgi:hypothetical protein
MEGRVTEASHRLSMEARQIIERLTDCRHLAAEMDSLDVGRFLERIDELQAIVEKSEQER